MSILSSQRYSANTSYFKDVISKVGIKLQPSDNPNLLKKEHFIISSDIQKELENHRNYPNNIPDFISGLKYFCRSNSLFKKALHPSVLQNKNEEDDSRGTEQESVFRILLCVDTLQKDIISILLDEITGYIDEDDGMDYIRLLLKPLLFLPYINDSQTLTFRLLEILEIAINSSQIELLNFIPDIIPDNNHDETAKKLSSILNQTTNNNDLIHAIINCLNGLNLSDDAKIEIEDQILALLNSTSSLATFSLIFDFLVTNYKSSNMQNILLKTRNALDSIMERLTENENTKSDQLITFEKIKKKIESSKSVSEVWTNLMNSIKSARDHKSVDIIILIMLHSNKKNIVETIFKKKVKNHVFSPTLLETALNRYLVPQILKEYINSILEVSEYLLRLNEPTYLEFATIFYSLTFGHKHTDLQQRQQIIHSLINLTVSSDKIRSRSLNVLKAISDQHETLLQSQTMQLMTLLNKIEDSNLGDVKQIYDLLAKLACGPNANSSMEAFKNNIFIILKKQLGTYKKSLKYSGIIGAIATAKNIATITDEEPSMSSDVSVSNICDIPNESSRQAANLLESAILSTSNCPIAKGLYYDQLAQMVVTSENLDVYFLAWLQDVTMNNFQEIYVSSDKPQPINDIPLHIQYNINAEGEIDEPIAIQISELTINASENNSMMLVIAPLIRLIRLISYRQNNKDLSNIDALLGCGVILPEIDPDIGIENYDSQQAPQVIDCLFHCINWFREIINAFVNQKQKSIKEKVLKRLNTLIKLEDLFINSMKTVPDHKLPPSYFYNVHLDSTHSTTNLDKTKSSDKSRKRKHPSTNVDNTTKITQTTLATTSKPTKKLATKEKENVEYNFREMDIDIILLLKYPLFITDNQSQDGLHLTISQLKFIMKDVVTKLTTVTKTGNTNVFSHLTTVKPDDLITDCVRLMPHVNNHLIRIIDEIKILLERSDGIHDCHEMFLQEATELKICFSLNLEMQSLILSWPGFQIGKNIPLLREYLKAFVDKEMSSQLISAQHLILEYLKYIVTLGEYCLSLPCAVHLINIIKALCLVSNDATTPKKRLVSLSGKLLSIRWFNLHGLPDTGAIANLHIDTLVKTHLKDSTLDTVSNIVSWIHIECSDLKSKDDNLKTFPAITKANFPILYLGVCTTLLEALQNEIHGKTNQEHLDLWLKIATTMRNLMDIVKIQETRTNLSSFLRKSMGILKVFLLQGLPILEIKLRTSSDRVLEILHTLQRSTRFIHNLCCHSKVTKDSSLIKYVPHMRLTLETFVYQVKAMLVANKCNSAYWMGILRNKNLHGEEINSTVDEEQEDNEEELPIDEESDEELINSSEIEKGSSLTV